MKRGFRVTTNTTLFDGADPKSVRAFFDEMMELGVEGMMLSPGLFLRKSAGPEAFPGARADAALVPRDSVEPQDHLAIQSVDAVPGISDGQARITPARPGACRLTTFLAGRSLVTCCRTATPIRFRNCGLTEWQNYGTESGNPKCANCMVHSGYEASAVDYTFSGLRGLWATAKATCSRATTRTPSAWLMLNEPVEPVHAYNPLVQINSRILQVGGDSSMTGPRHADRPEHTVNPEKLEVAPGSYTRQLQGWIPELASEEELREALEKAFDYRGDVTITRKDGSKFEGYIFDRVSGTTLASSYVRVLPKDSNQRLKIAYAEIAALAFSGRDTAAGKSWEAWVQKYWSKSKRTGAN